MKTTSGKTNAAVLAFLHANADENGTVRSIRQNEISSSCGFAQSQVSFAVAALERAGLLRIEYVRGYRAIYHLARLSK